MAVSQTREYGTRSVRKPRRIGARGQELNKEGDSYMEIGSRRVVK